MLTDLRDKLKGVGRLDMMYVVNERALNYYAERPQQPARGSLEAARASCTPWVKTKRRAGSTLGAYQVPRSCPHDCCASRKEPNDPERIFASRPERVLDRRGRI